MIAPESKSDAQTKLRKVCELFEAHRHALENFCFRMVGHRQAAQDLTQEVFLKALESRAPVETPWLFKVARNGCIDHLRRASGWRRAWDRMQGRELAMTFADELVEREVGLQLLKALPPKQRALLLLKEYADLNYQQLAQIFDTSSNSIGVMLNRARKRAADLLEEMNR